MSEYASLSAGNHATSSWNTHLALPQAVCTPAATSFKHPCFEAAGSAQAHSTMHCRVTRNMAAVVHSGMLQDGILAAQDEAAGLVVAALDPQPGDAILDTCAAPGGKAIYCAQRMQRQAPGTAEPGAALGPPETQSQARDRAGTDVAEEPARMQRQASGSADTAHAAEGQPDSLVLAMDVNVRRLGLVEQAAFAAGVRDVIHTVSGDLKLTVGPRCAC